MNKKEEPVLRNEYVYKNYVKVAEAAAKSCPRLRQAQGRTLPRGITAVAYRAELKKSCVEECIVNVFLPGGCGEELVEEVSSVYKRKEKEGHEKTYVRNSPTKE